MDSEIGVPMSWRFETAMGQIDLVELVPYFSIDVLNG